MPAISPRPWILRVAIALAVAAGLLSSGLVARSAGDLRSQITAKRSAADALKAQIAADSRQIDATSNGLQVARDRLAAVQSTLDRRVGQLKGVQTHLIDARNHLVDLENRLQAATTALSANLVANYEGQKPDLVSVILNSRGFGDLLNQMGFMQRIAHQDGHIVSSTRDARAEVSREATRLEGLEIRDRALANQILDQRNQVAALQAALSRREIAQMSQRSQTSSRYHEVSAQLGTLQRREQEQEKRAAEAAVRAAQTGNAAVGGITINTGGMVQAPAGAPEAVTPDHRRRQRHRHPALHLRRRPRLLPRRWLRLLGLRQLRAGGGRAGQLADGLGRLRGLGPARARPVGHALRQRRPHLDGGRRLAL